MRIITSACIRSSSLKVPLYGSIKCQSVVSMRSETCYFIW